MPIIDLYSKRQKNFNDDSIDLFTYDTLPESFRIQAIYIIQEVLGNGLPKTISYNIYRQIRDILRKEYGVFKLFSGNTPYDEVIGFFLNCPDTNRALDVIELCCFSMGTITSNPNQVVFPRSPLSAYSMSAPNVDEAIKELNARLFEHGIGYQFENEGIVRVDSKPLHNEVVKPVFLILSDPLYRGANDEFSKAHDHYRYGRYAECLNECLKAFESTMKIICAKRQWTYDSNDTAKKLLAVCFKKGLVPSYLQTQFSALQAVFESGVPTLRNKLSGHGQGTNQVNIPNHFASFMLHITASTILFLVNSEMAKDHDTPTT